MKITSKEELTDYLAKLYNSNWHEYQAIITHAQMRSTSLSKEARNKSRKSYLNRKQKFEKRSLQLFDIVDVGNVVQVTGTKDGIGLRLVLEKTDHQLICRKVRPVKLVSGNDVVFRKEPYITTHGNTKIIRVIDNVDSILD